MRAMAAFPKVPLCPPRDVIKKIIAFFYLPVRSVHAGASSLQKLCQNVNRDSSISITSNDQQMMSVNPASPGEIPPG